MDLAADASDRGVSVRRAARNPLLAAGFAIMLLGAGNWINGQQKLAEYAALVQQDATRVPAESFGGFPHLTAETNAALLRPLRSPLGTRSFAQGKLEFYRVVLMGGRLFALFGAFTMVVALIWDRRRQTAAVGQTDAA